MLLPGVKKEEKYILRRGFLPEIVFRIRIHGDPY